MEKLQVNKCSKCGKPPHKSYMAFGHEYITIMCCNQIVQIDIASKSENDCIKEWNSLNKE